MSLGLPQRMEERFAGLQLPEDLTFYQSVRYTLLLRHSDTLDGVDWSRPIKLRVRWDESVVQMGHVWGLGLRQFNSCPCCSVVFVIE